MNRIQTVISRRKRRAKLLKMMTARKSRSGARRKRRNALITIGKPSQKGMMSLRSPPKALRNPRRRIRLAQPDPNHRMLRKEEIKRTVVGKEERPRILMTKMQTRHRVLRSLLNQEGR